MHSVYVYAGIDVRMMCVSHVLVRYTSVSVITPLISVIALRIVHYQHIVYIMYGCTSCMNSSSGSWLMILDDNMHAASHMCGAGSGTASLMLKIMHWNRLCTGGSMNVNVCSRCSNSRCYLISMCQFNYLICIDGMASDLLMFQLYMGDGSKRRGENVMLMRVWSRIRVSVDGTDSVGRLY
jgi:hypothetical protein